MWFGPYSFRALAMALSNDSVRPEDQHDPAKAVLNPFYAWPLFFAAAVKCLSLVAFTSILASIFLASLSASSAVAQDKKDHGDLGTQATNPAAALILVIIRRFS